MSDLPKTRYAKSGEVHIAYQVLGDGPIDLLWVPGFVSHLEYDWEHPRPARFFRRLASFSRLIRFDKRGTGLSDRVAIPTLEERMDDVRAILDATGSSRAAPAATSNIAIRPSPLTVTQSSAPLRVKVGSCGSRPTSNPLVIHSLFVVSLACALGTFPITRRLAASIRYTLLVPLPVVAISELSGDGAAPWMSIAPW
jgi:hypothetical protein